MQIQRLRIAAGVSRSERLSETIVSAGSHGSAAAFFSLPVQGSARLKRTNISSLRMAAPESMDSAARGIAPAR